MKTFYYQLENESRPFKIMIDTFVDFKDFLQSLSDGFNKIIKGFSSLDQETPILITKPNI